MEICHLFWERWSRGNTLLILDVHEQIRSALLSRQGFVVLQQGSGINVFFNYAEEVYRGAVLAMTLVDRFGRSA
jgi:hypothetical protein